MNTPNESTFPPLGESRTRSDLVVESIRTAILSGKLRPREVLVERRIGEELGVSKTPVREALIVLAQNGLLEVTRNKGMAVRELSLTDVRHVFEQRILLEPWAVADAVRRGTIAIAAAANSLDEARAFAEAGDTAGHALANRRFHRELYSGCENSFITHALDGLSDVTALATTGVLWENWPTFDEEGIEHRAILDAAVAGDADGAAALVRNHIETSVARVKAKEVAALQ